MNSPAPFNFQALAEEAAATAPVPPPPEAPFPKVAPRTPRPSTAGLGPPLPEITQALCLAIARSETYRLKGLALQAAAKLGSPRGDRIRSAFEHIAEVGLKHWEQVTEHRPPYIPQAVLGKVAEWLVELDNADELVMAGERVLPLLLVGETRCGKTSLASVIAHQRGHAVYRLNLAQAVDSHLGQTAKCLEKAIAETGTRPGFWLIDEIDAVAFKRTGGDAAAQERAHSVGSLLTRLDQLPPGLPLIATTNHRNTIDSAVLGRFNVIDWPRWKDLDADERDMFLTAQGGHGIPTQDVASYADAVKLARAKRVAAILSPIVADGDAT